MWLLGTRKTGNRFEDLLCSMVTIVDNTVVVKSKFAEKKI